MFIFIGSRQLQVLGRSLLRFLHESMKTNHSASFVHVKEHSCNTVLSQLGAYLMDPIAECLAHWHSNRPTKLHSLDVRANSLTVVRQWQSLQPVPQRFAPRLRSIKDRRNPLTLSFNALRRRRRACCEFAFRTHRLSVPYKVHPKALCGVAVTQTAGGSPRSNFSQPCVVIRISNRPDPCYPYTFLYADEHDTIGRDSG